MITHLTQTLDIALARYRDHEPLSVILAEYPTEAEALRPLLETAVALETLLPVEMPASEALAADRNTFLAHLAKLLPQAVSPGPLARLKGWMAPRLPWNLPIFQQKEPNRMTTLLLKAALALSMIFGSVGGTAVLAADSLPDSPLYPLKLTIEEARLAMASEPADQAVLHLAFAQERAQEIEELALAGEIPDEAALERLQLHLEQALHLAAQLPDETMMSLLVQAQEMVQTQEQALVAAQAAAAGPAQDALQQANGMLAQVRETVEAGLQDPQTFRWQYSNMPEGMPQETGPCNTGECEPAGDENHHGQDGDNSGQNGPGGGDGECDNPGECEPAGDENHHGQDGGNSSQNGPGDGDGVCDNPDGCQPAGNESHHGHGGG